ncbi:MAG: Rieske (2Fe-2S) protein [Alphaproteobacteria bacterium]
MMSEVPSEPLVHVGSLRELAEKGRRVVKVGRRQIALFLSGDRVYACNNRCPHEGYPLKEGTLTQGCILTCNWHNWKFDLETGETLTGGDQLRRYPVHVTGDEIWLDPRDAPAEARIADAMTNLRDAFERYDYERMAREIARLEQAGGDPLDAVRAAVQWSRTSFEFGTTHAAAAAADWLRLRETRVRSRPSRLAALLEIIGHFAWDTLQSRGRTFPFPSGADRYDRAALVDAIEREDENAAVRLARGALHEGKVYADLEPALTEAALAHYLHFGHALIYVVKTGGLVERLGAPAVEALVLTLVRSLVTGRREDLIPEFRGYAGARARWNGAGTRTVTAEEFMGLSAARAMDLAVQASAQVGSLYDALIGAAARNMLCFDASWVERNDQAVAHNVGWLDFTHPLTFANAAHTQCEKFPELWPSALLQMACFVGRNAGYVEIDQDVSSWWVDDRRAFFDNAYRRVLDHGQADYIISCHYLKVLTAVEEEVARRPQAPWTGDILAATNRYLNAPVKRRHILRTARQARRFVELGG